MDRVKTVWMDMDAAPVSGLGLRLMSCAVALTACAEGSPSPASTSPRPLVRVDGPRPPAPVVPLRGERVAQAPTGAPCDDAVGDCGVGRLCIEGWPGGYCTGGCQDDLDCAGEGAGCVAAVPGVSGVCLVGCDEDVECGEGYACDGAYCWPAPPSLR